MADLDTHHELMGVFVETARAHHKATGGVNRQWAEWYAERAVGDVNRLLDSDMSLDELADFLSEADRRYRTEEPELSWPRAYAVWLVGDAEWTCMRAFVTGGSGFVGGHLIRRLVTEGHEVSALARSDQSVARVRALGANAVRGALAEKDLMAGAMDGCDVVFHCAAWVGTWGDRAQAVAVNVTGTANVITAARAAGVRRLIHLSTESVMIDGRPLNGIDESVPIPDSGHLSVYAETKAAAERLVLGSNGSGLETIAIRPRLIWGPQDSNWLPGLVEKTESGLFRWVDQGRHLASTCHVYNTIEAMLLAVDGGTPGEAYYITDGPAIPFKEFAAPYLATAGVVVSDSSAPGWLMQAAGAFLEGTWRVLGLPSAPPINRIEAYMVSHPQVFDDGKARRELGYDPVITIELGLAELAEG